MKKSLRIIVSLLIIVGLYNLAVFVIPFERESVFWIAYAFTMVAFGIGMGGLLWAVGRDSIKSKFYGYPIARVATIYMVVQGIAGLISMIVGTYIPWEIPVLVFAILLGAAGIGLISTTGVIAEIERQDEQQRKDVLLMHALQSKVNQIASQCDVPAVKALAEELRYSDPVTNEMLQDHERELTVLVSNMQDAALEGNNAQVELLCRQATAVLSERNRLCKLNKNL